MPRAPATTLLVTRKGCADPLPSHQGKQVSPDRAASGDKPRAPINVILQPPPMHTAQAVPVTGQQTGCPQSLTEASEQSKLVFVRLERHSLLRVEVAVLGLGSVGGCSALFHFSPSECGH